MRQMDRRLLILMRLREESAVRASDLAAECGCSVRTVYRDLDALSQSGVPVAAMPGEGYRLVPGYHLPPVAFTADEAVQLLLGADIALGLGTAPQREATHSAAAKVEAVLQPETRATVKRLRDRIRIAREMQREPSPWLPVLQQAVLQQRVLLLRYHSFSPDEITERRVEGHGLVYYGNDWHMVAYCRLREAMRDFRASRIREAELLPETFERLDEVQWYADDTDARSFEVRVWVDAATVAWARETPAFGFEREERGEGGSTFFFACRDVRRLVPWVLSWGAAARVLSPPEVVEQVRQEAQRLVTRYASE
jgi:predicted DNA-binding transcriptional regulator YafY